MKMTSKCSLSLQKLMALNPFVDSLMLDNFDIFKEVITDFKNIKLDLKIQNRRVNKPVYTYTAYEGLKEITANIQRVWNGRRIKDSTALELFKNAVRKVNLLIRDLKEFGRNALASILERLEQKLLDLLPSNTAVQLDLFDADRFDTGSEECPVLPGFQRWKSEAQNKSYSRIREAILNPVKTTFTKLVQLSINFASS